MPIISIFFIANGILFPASTTSIDCENQKILYIRHFTCLSILPFRNKELGFEQVEDIKAVANNKRRVHRVLIRYDSGQAIEIYASSSQARAEAIASFIMNHPSSNFREKIRNSLQEIAL